MTELVSAAQTAILGRDYCFDSFDRGNALDSIEYFSIRHAAFTHALLLGLSISPEDLTQEPLDDT
jgi:hypothetical protein